MELGAGGRARQVIVDTSLPGVKSVEGARAPRQGQISTSAARYARSPSHLAELKSGRTVGQHGLIVLCLTFRRRRVTAVRVVIPVGGELVDVHAKRTPRSTFSCRAGRTKFELRMCLCQFVHCLVIACRHTRHHPFLGTHNKNTVVTQLLVPWLFPWYPCTAAG